MLIAFRRDMDNIFNVCSPDRGDITEVINTDTCEIIKVTKDQLFRMRGVENVAKYRGSVSYNFQLFGSCDRLNLTTSTCGASIGNKRLFAIFPVEKDANHEFVVKSAKNKVMCTVDLVAQQKEIFNTGVHYIDIVQGMYRVVFYIVFLNAVYTGSNDKDNLHGMRMFFILDKDKNFIGIQKVEYMYDTIYFESNIADEFKLDRSIAARLALMGY